jgi:two-component system CitB family sensor kinase
MTPMFHSRVRRLSSQIFAAQLAILAVTVLIGFLLFVHEERIQLDRQYEQRAAAIAQTVAGVPSIGRCLTGGDCPLSVQQTTQRLQRETSAAYIVVIDMNRVRHSHPDPALIGAQVSEPIVTVDGRTHVGIDNGSTGRSANGKAPLYALDGRMIGEVSVGIRESSVSAALWRELPAYGAWFAVALAIGALASWLLARRLKRRTFGLELDEIAHLLREREATLHGIREGMIAFDGAERITMVNDEARRLLGLGTTPIGGKLDDLVGPGRLHDVLSGNITGKDEVVLTDDFALTVNRMPILLGGHPQGAVVTLRDRTEMAGLLRELDGVRSLTDSLRAQQHEFTNRLHTIAGMLELGHRDEALGYLTELQGTAAGLADSLRSRIASPQIVGLLLGKMAEAGERGIDLRLSEDTWLGEAPEKVQALTTILGNLIDNAFDAVAGISGKRQVRVALIEDDDAITVQVSDTGPGVPADATDAIFVDGYTTKAATTGSRRGLGLALVHRLVQRLDGTITVSAGSGAVFVVRLPKASAGVRQQDLVG